MCSWKIYSLSNSLSSGRHSNHFSKLMVWHPSRTDLEVMAHTPCLSRLTLAHSEVPWIGLAVGKDGYKKRESCMYLALFSKFCFHENPREWRRHCQDTYKIAVTCWTIPYAVSHWNSFKFLQCFTVCKHFHIHYLNLINISSDRICKRCRAKLLFPFDG